MQSYEMMKRKDHRLYDSFHMKCPEFGSHEDSKWLLVARV
jgi:hypothetical protein